MNFPLTISDISLWLAIAAIVLIVTSEFLNALPEYSRRIRVDKSRLRLAAIGCGLAFLVTVLMRVI